MSRPAPPLRADRVRREPHPGGAAALDRLAASYGNCAPEQADVIVALGGDGLMLQTLHEFMNSGKPIYGMHRGTVGFLMNDFSEDDLTSGWPRRRRP